MRKGQLLEAILEQKEAMHKDGCNVAMSPRRDVPTSRSWVHNIKVNKRQRRDVGADSVLSSFKSKKGGRNWRYRELYEHGAEIRAAVTSISKKSPGFVFFFVLDNRTDVLYITYWYFLIYDVLDLHLGYC